MCDVYWVSYTLMFFVSQYLMFNILFPSFIVQLGNRVILTNVGYPETAVEETKLRALGRLTKLR